MASAASKGYQRFFIIFSNEDAGFEEGTRPSGHVKIEVRDKKGRLSAAFQNLRNGYGKFGYGLYLMRTDKGTVEYVRAGSIRHSGSKAILDMTFDQGGLGGAAYSIEDFDTYAVLTEAQERPGANISCPLAAYRNGRTEWRSGLRKVIQEKMNSSQIIETKPVAVQQTQADLPIEMNQPEQVSETENDILPEFMYEQESGVQTKKEVQSEVNQEISAEANTEKNAEESANIYVEKDEKAVTEKNVQIDIQAGEEFDPEEVKDTAATLFTGSEQQEQQKQQEQQANQKQRENQEQQVQQAQHEPNDQQKQQAQQEKQEQQKQQGSYGKESKPSDRLNNLNTGCVYLNGNLCGDVFNSSNSADPCSTCRINRREEPDPAGSAPRGDIDGLEEELDNNFDISDPFHSRRSDYKWWRVTNPVNLNNIFYRNKIRSPLMFNPAVMMAHYKYKHLIVGIFDHKTGKRYIVCGVPGMHMVDAKPFGEVSKWVQSEGSRLRYGAFGYWLIYIDPEDGRIINFGM